MSEPSVVKVNGSVVPVDVNNKFRTMVQTYNGSVVNTTLTATDGSGNVTTRNLSGAVLFPSYDLDGNLTSDGVKTYEFDAANRLLAINYPSSGTRTEFAYDGLGRRVQIIEKTGGTVNSTKKFVWIGNFPVEERDASNNITKRFYAEGEQIGANSYLFNRDHLGSIREMVNADNIGTVRARYSYDPYGRRTKISGDLEADFGFTGHYWHAPSSLCLSLYRPYIADLGRWASRDPLNNAEMRQGPNLYSYVQNSPISWIDPLGLWSLCDSANDYSNLNTPFKFTHPPIVGNGNLRLDDDGTGSSHGDPYHQNVTSYRPGGHSMNADTDVYIVAPLDSRSKGVRKGDQATMSGNGHCVSGPIGDFGPSKNGWGEASLAAAHGLGVPTVDKPGGPVPKTPGGADVPVTVTVSPSAY